MHADDSTLSDDGRFRSVVPPSSPEQIGPYKIRQVLGEGGFGIVYQAEQTSPVCRNVALKVIKPGMDSEAVLARFEAERQALAYMDHPSIAKVFDAGISNAGRPYFAMELVRGEPISEFCDRNRIPLRERLRVFMRVCNAVQHAHSKGVIHRDLKPSNILVAYSGEESIPKVIDFGVAKALNQKLSEHTVFTLEGQLIGTPEYMSPEQAEMGATDIDTRSDVYSLGVILYELLTGTRPFDSETLRGAGLDEIRRIIRETEPPKPSTRLASLAASPDSVSRIALARKTEFKALTSTLRSDLDWVVMKCLEKDRARRYATASEIACEIERFLNDEPVMAGPPSIAYRARKFYKRNKASVVALGFVLLTLVSASVVATSYAISESQASHELVIQQRQTSEELRRASQLLAMTNAVLQWDGVQDETGDIQLALYKRVVDWLERAPAEHPEIRALQYISAAESLISSVHDEIDIRLLLNNARAELSRLSKPPVSLLGRIEVVEAWRCQMEREYDEGIEHAEKAIAYLEKAPLSKHRADAQRVLSMLYLRAGDRERSVLLMQDAFVTIWHLTGREADRSTIENELRELSRSLQTHWDAGRPGSAYSEARDFVEPIVQAIGADPMIPEGATAIAMYLDWIEGNESAAMPMYRLAVQLGVELLGPAHPTTRMVDDAMRSNLTIQAVDANQTVAIMRASIGVYGNYDYALNTSRQEAIEQFAKAGEYQAALDIVNESLALYRSDECDRCWIVYSAWRIYMATLCNNTEELDQAVQQAREWLDGSGPLETREEAESFAYLSHAEAMVMQTDRTFERYNERLLQTQSQSEAIRNEILPILISEYAELSRSHAAQSVIACQIDISQLRLRYTSNTICVILDTALNFLQEQKYLVACELLELNPEQWQDIQFQMRHYPNEYIPAISRHRIWRSTERVIQSGGGIHDTQQLERIRGKLNNVRDRWLGTVRYVEQVLTSNRIQ